MRTRPRFARARRAGGTFVQWLDGTWVARRVLAKVWSSEYGERTPRPFDDRDLPEVAVRFSPVRFPQRGWRTTRVSRLPAVDRAGFDRFVRTCRRRARVVIAADALRPPEAVDALTALALAGAPLALEASPGDVAKAAHLPIELHDRRPSDARARELGSIRLRRAAHDQVWHPDGAEPFVSVLLASKRPADIDVALRSIRLQLGCRVETIVGLHGDHWHDDDVERVRASGDGTVLTFPDRTSLGSVLAGLTERATAPLVTKWDDDDWYGRHHLADLVRAHEYSGADLVGKAAEFVYVESADITVRRSSAGAETFSWTLAGGTLLLSPDVLRRLGGWPDVPRSVDRALLDAARSAGCRPYRTHGFQYVLRRRMDARHTWAADDSYFLEQAISTWPGHRLDVADVADVADAADRSS